MSIARLDHHRAGTSGTLNDIAYRALKDAILSCKIAPGESVSENELVDRLQCGKAAIRHAINRLSQEGLLATQPRRGTIATPVTLEAMQHLFDMRLILEPEAARRAAGRLDQPTIDRLIAATEGDYKPGDRDSETAFLRDNRAFHTTVAEASGNPRLAASIALLLDEVERMLHLGLAKRSRGGEFHHAHREILRALIVGDSERAARLSYAEIRSGHEMMADAFMALG
jgi:DNA-binding GntR family transcriptional regulator